MLVKRRDLIKHLEKHGFYLLREGKKHSIYTNDVKTIPVKSIELLIELLQTNYVNRQV